MKYEHLIYVLKNKTSIILSIGMFAPQAVVCNAGDAE